MKINLDNLRPKKIEYYINLEGRDFNFELRNILHYIKYHDLKFLKCFIEYNLKSLDQYSENEFDKICKLATVLSYKMRVDGLEEYIQPWMLDKRLYLKVPYFSYHDKLWVMFQAPQEFYDHNVFYVASSLEVL